MSGGLDSAACLDFFTRIHRSVRGLFINYGQPAAHQETVAASRITSHFGVSIRILTIKGASRKNKGEVLGRNALLLSAALAEAGPAVEIIALGVHGGTPYYDCSPSFVETVQRILDGYSNGRIRLMVPFLEWSKSDIWDYCIEQGVPMELTYSCEQGTWPPCGGCISCRDLEALRAR